MARKRDYDLVILGGGSAGITAAMAARGLGLCVLLAECETRDGERLNTECAASKALLYAAHLAYAMRVSAAEAGLPAHSVTREEAAGVLARVRATVSDLRDASRRRLSDAGVETAGGAARFRGAHTLALDGRTITSEYFLIATGSYSDRPEIPGLGEDYLTDRNLFDLREIPEALLVVGGGSQGVEMAQAFARLGSRVTLAQKDDRLLPRDDHEFSDKLTQYLRDEGINVRTGAVLHSVHPENSRRVAIIREYGNLDGVPFTHLLYAGGRRASIDGLGLEALGVSTSGGGIVVDARLRTAASNIYACGDVIGGPQYAHSEEREAKTVIRNIFFPGTEKAKSENTVWATFTDPELVHIGMTEDEALSRGLPYEVYYEPFANNDRAVTDHATQGGIKILTVGAGGKILGVHLLGRRASELAPEWVLAMEQGASVLDIADLIHIAPTMSRVSQQAAQHWREATVKDPVVAKTLSVYAKTIRPNLGAIAIGGAALIAAGAAAALLHSSRPTDDRE